MASHWLFFFCYVIISPTLLLCSFFFRKLRKSQLVPDIRPGSVFCLPSLTNNDSKEEGHTDEHVLNDIEAGIYLSI